MFNILGYNDYQDSAPKYLDKAVSYTWLRAFEGLQNFNSSVILRELNYNYGINTKIRGVNYFFTTAHFPDLIDIFGEKNPKICFFNFCNYYIAQKGLRRLRFAYPDCSFVMRLHHELKMLQSQPGFLDAIKFCDVIIVPMEYMKSQLHNLGFRVEIFVVPFCVRSEVMSLYRRPWHERVLDLVCANTNSPQKNTGLLNEVFAKLENLGYKCLNVSGCSVYEMAKIFGRSKFFFQPSLSDASGSRVLLEGYCSGCVPIGVQESLAIREVVKEMGGYIIRSGSSIDFSTLEVTNSPDSTDCAVNQLIDIYSHGSNNCVTGQQTEIKYSEDTEINELMRIINKSVNNRNTGIWKNIESIIFDDTECEGDIRALNSRINQTSGEHVALIAEKLSNFVGIRDAYYGISEQIGSQKFDLREAMTWLFSQENYTLSK